MPTPLTEDIKTLVDGSNFAHLATLMPDGSPQSVPVWVDREREHLLICTGENSLKAKNARRDPRVAFSIIDFHDPYRKDEAFDALNLISEIESLPSPYCVMIKRSVKLVPCRKSVSNEKETR